MMLLFFEEFITLIYKVNKRLANGFGISFFYIDHKMYLNVFKFKL